MPGSKRKSSWDRPDEFDWVLVVADDDPLHLQSIVERLSSLPGRQRAPVLGRYPRYRIISACDGEEVLSKVKEDVSVAAIDLVMPRRSGIDVIQELRVTRNDLAILAFTAGAPPSEAVAAVMAGADHFYEFRDLDGFEHALDLAIDRRRLTRLIEQNEAEVQNARRRLANLSGNWGTSLPGLRPPQTPEAVIPFHEAVRRYLVAAARIFKGDSHGLALRLGMSYFSLRRLLLRYGVPLPGRVRKGGSRKG